MIRLHRDGQIEDEVLHDLERDLDFEGLCARLLVCSGGRKADSLLSAILRFEILAHMNVRPVVGSSEAAVYGACGSLPPWVPTCPASVSEA